MSPSVDSFPFYSYLKSPADMENCLASVIENMSYSVLCFCSWSSVLFRLICLESTMRADTAGGLSVIVVYVVLVSKRPRVIGVTLATLS